MKRIIALMILIPGLLFGATRNVVPNGNGQGSIGVSTNQWGAGYFSNLYANGASVLTNESDTLQTVVNRGKTVTNTTAAQYQTGAIVVTGGGYFGNGIYADKGTAGAAATFDDGTHTAIIDDGTYAFRAVSGGISVDNNLYSYFLHGSNLSSVFLATGGKAADSELLDGLDSSLYTTNGATASSAYYLISNAAWISNNVLGWIINTNFIPSVSNAYDLGSLAYPFRDIYLSSNSIYMGGKQVISYSNSTLVVSTGISNSEGVVYSPTGSFSTFSLGGIEFTSIETNENKFLDWLSTNTYLSVAEDYTNIATNDVLNGVVMANVVTNNQPTISGVVMANVVTNGATDRGATNATVNGAIQSYDSSTRVLALTTSGGGGATTDDTNALRAATIICTNFTAAGIQTCLNSLTNGGGEVYLPAGTYNCSNVTIRMPGTNITIRGSGWSTLLDASGGQTNSIISLGGYSGTVLRDFQLIKGGTTFHSIKGDSANEDNILFYNLWFNGTAQEGIYQNNVGQLNWKVSNCLFNNTGDYGIFSVGGVIHVEQCRFGPTANAIRFQGTSPGCSVSGCYFDRTTGARGIVGFGTVTPNVDVTGNYFTGGNDYEAIQASPGWTIRGNTIVSSPWYGIILPAGADRCIIQNNVILYTSTFQDISVSSMSNVISGNILISSAGKSPNGVYLAATAHNNIISGNTIAGHDTSGIHILAGATNNLVYGNNCSGETVMQYRGLGTNGLSFCVSQGIEWNRSNLSNYYYTTSDGTNLFQIKVANNVATTNRIDTAGQRLGVMMANYTTNDATESTSLFGPLPYNVTITNCIATGLGGTYASDWFWVPGTNPAYGTKTLFITGAVYTVDTGVTNIPVNYLVTNGCWIGTYCTNGFPTNGSHSLPYTY